MHVEQIKLITVTPAAASFATPYSSGDVIGGINTLANAFPNPGAGAIILAIEALDKANAKSALDLIFFSAAPANSIGADNAAYALNDADLPLVVGRYSLASASWISSGSTNAEASVANLWIPVQAAVGSTSLYMAVISRGTPTYGSATDLIIKVGLNQL